MLDIFWILVKNCTKYPSPSLIHQTLLWNGHPYRGYRNKSHGWHLLQRYDTWKNASKMFVNSVSNLATSNRKFFCHICFRKRFHNWLLHVRYSHHPNHVPVHGRTYEQVLQHCHQKVAKVEGLQPRGGHGVWPHYGLFYHVQPRSGFWSSFVPYSRRMVIFWLTLLLLYQFVHNWIWRLCGITEWQCFRGNKSLSKSFFLQCYKLKESFQKLVTLAKGMT